MSDQELGSSHFKALGAWLGAAMWGGLSLIPPWGWYSYAFTALCALSVLTAIRTSILASRS